MELVPFLDKWAGSETKHDLKAIYRRPGVGINLTGPLPVRRHADWTSKGFSWVTLAAMADLALVANDLRAHGYDPLRMRSTFTPQGVFDVPAYIKDEQKNDAVVLAELQAKVDKFGADAVVEMMQMSEPGFTLPEGIRTTPPPQPPKATPVGTEKVTK